jgi:group I intron endonuclease
MHIYKITNTVNSKVYIGQTIQENPKMRWYEHCACARAGKKSYLYDSIRKHGVEMFTWEIIDTACNIEELNLKEQYWLEHYRSVGVVYNNREAGNNKTHSAESIERMRAAQKLRHSTTNVGGWKRRDGGAMKGKAHPGKGKKRTLEQLETIRSAVQKRTNYRIGKVYVEIDGKKKWIESR